MKRKILFYFLLLVAAPVIFVPVTYAQTLTWEDVGTSLVCQCGCQSVLPSCPHIECGSAPQMKADIKEMIGRGMDKNQIITAFMQNYGEQVLAAPTKKGFNLTAWIAPFVALIVGAIALFLTIRGWVTRSKLARPTREVKVRVENEDPYKKRLEEELRSWKA